jgi:uncharacterized membrane protein YgdD (TMEM256/DUF423 family)
MIFKSKSTFLWGVVLMTLSVMMGAMGAHALKEKLDPNLLDSYQTGVNYMIYMGLSFLILSLVDSNLTKLSVILMKIGLILFSGSIYVLVFLKHSIVDIPGFLVALTPIGGSLLIIGWIVLLIKVLKSN